MLIGLDGADWRVLSPFVDGGDMPALRSIVEGGSSGRLLPCDPVGSATAWATALTGCGAHVHGVLSDEIPDSATGRPRPVRASDRVAPTIWEIASAAGLSTLAIGWGEPFASVPPTASGDNAAAVPEPIASIAASAPADDADLAGLLAAGARSDSAIVARARAAMVGVQWRFAAVRLPAFGALASNFLRFMPPSEPGVLAARAVRYAGTLREICRLYDRFIADLREAAGAGAAIFVASERGIDVGRWRHPPNSPAARATDAVPPGIIAMAGASIAADSLVHGTRSTQLAALVARSIGVEMPPVQPAVPLPDFDASPQPEDGRAPLRGLRQAVFAAAAAACGDRASSRLARRAIFRDCPSNAANAAAFAELLASDGGASGLAEALSVLDASAAELRSGDPIRWILEAARSRVLLSSGQPSLARAAAADARTAGAPSAEADHLEACAALGEGAASDAERLCRRALESDPSHHGASSSLATALCALGRFDEAVAAARAALGRRWFDPDLHVVLGTALAAKGLVGEALSSLDLALRQAPGHPGALRRLAAIRARRLGDIEGASNALREAARSAARPRPPSR